MKKIILMLFILVTSVTFSQDAFITIGKLKLRYDADSNKLKIGYVGTYTGISSLRIAKELDGQLFNFNTAQFTWNTTTGLNLSSSVFSNDSLYSKIMSSYKDTSWVVLGESVYKYKFLSLKKLFYGTSSNSFMDWKYYYRSFDESGTLVSIDSAIAVNNISEIDQVENVQLQYDGTFAKIDSLLLDAGTYNIAFSFVFERNNPADISAIGIRDTIEIAIKQQGSAPNVYIKRNIYDIFMYSAENDMNGGVLTWNAKHTVTSRGYVYLYGLYRAIALSNALAIGVTCTIIRGSIVATQIY